MGCQYEHVPVGDSDHYGVLPNDPIGCADQMVKKGVGFQIADWGFRIAELKRR
jgi:hypothetical protein